MTQRSSSPADRPDSRRDSTHPARSGRGVNGTPYPGAPAPARGSKDMTRPRRAAAPPRTLSRARSAAPTPATVWAAGPDPIDPAAAWPVPVVEAITTGFSAPGARVLLAPWPTPADDFVASTPGPADRERSAPAESELAAARDAVEGLGRTASLARLVPGGALPGVSSRPFWADFVTDSPTRTTVPGGQPVSGSGTPLAEVSPVAGDSAPERVDLIITALPADRSEDGSVDAMALAASDLLTFGGILAVYTHSDWYGGQLIDPSGPMVAAGQSADLLYLQHIVTLHTPIRDGHLQPLPASGQTADHAQAARRAGARGLPAPHVHAHGDLLIFAQARTPALTADTASGSDTASGELR